MNRICIKISIGIYAVAITVLFSCSKPLPIKNIIISKDDLPTIEIANLQSSYTQDGRMKGKLQSALAQQYDGIVEPYVDFPKGISIVLFNKEGRMETSLTANRAVYYQSKQTWEAIGNIVISNINGDVLQTQKLYGDEKEKKIFTDKYVQITKSDGTIIKGEKGFESNTEFTIYQFIDVSGRIAFSDGFTEDSISVNNQVPSNTNKPVLPKNKEKTQIIP